jgi:hypothetical protein
MITADQAMYASKRQGKNRVAGFPTSGDAATDAASAQADADGAPDRAADEPDAPDEPDEPGEGKGIGVMAAGEDQRDSV